ncbi:hypothetical protein [Ruegeria lacuscaerulensis]|uniref:hypothetical protein n=1 Tax=Ruegeria lacuscaerulensis TaxID=55218 RepID=UPI00147F8663|nr:hypothetical protein [Ruegeria lacuscaerulensis]
MKLRSTLILTIAAAAIISGAASAQVKLRPSPKVGMPFGEYRKCLGYSGAREYGRQFVKDDQARMAEAGQSADKQPLVTNWSVVILNEQVIAAHEATIEQCNLRKSGETFSTECPLGGLSREDAAQKVGADQDEFWTQPSDNLAALKKEQRTRLEALRPAIEEACGP